MHASAEKKQEKVAQKVTDRSRKKPAHADDHREETQSIHAAATLANKGSNAVQLKALLDQANRSTAVRQLTSMQSEAGKKGKGIQPHILLQGKFTGSVTQKKDKPAASGATKTGLPSQLKAGVEQLSGQSMDDVQVTYNSDKPAQLSAHAFAQGSDIHLAPNQEKHLPHEAWHVAQQKQGRVQATTQMKGKVPINDDAALEKEADIMGAKALSAGMSSAKTLQKKDISGVEVAQREEKDEQVATPDAEAQVSTEQDTAPAIDPALVEKINANRGLIDMAKNAQAVLANASVWAAVAGKETDIGAAVVAGGEVTGGLTTIAGSATSLADEAAGSIVSAVGAGISGLFTAVKAASNIYSAAKNKDFVAGTAGARDLLATLKSGFISAQQVLKYINGSVPTSVAAAIPGIGIAVSAANIIINAYNGLQAKSAEAEMLVVSNAYRQDLAKLLGRAPEANKKLLDTEARGKLGSRVDYLRLTPGAKLTLASIQKSGDPEAEFNKHKAKFGIPPHVSFADFYAAIQTYELGSKMQEINQKRKVYSGREIAADLISIAGDIAAFFPADGGITAVALKGTSAAVKGAQSLGKAVQGFARDHDILADSTRSSDVKHAEYVGHTKTIYSMLAGVGLAGKEDSAITAADITKATSAERMIVAAGASPSVLYQTNYSNVGSVIEQVKSIVEAMKKGR